MDLRDYLRIIKGRKNIIILSLFITIVTYLSITLLKPTVYVATSTIMVIKQPYLISSREMPIVSPLVSLEDQLQLMQEEETAKKVSQYLKDKYKVKVMPGEVISSSSLSIVEKSNLIRCQVRSPFQNKAIYIARAYAEISALENQRLAGEKFIASKNFLEEQIRKYSDKMEKAEEALGDFNQKYGTIDYNEEILRMKERVSKQESDIQETDESAKGIERTIVQLNSKLYNISEFKKSKVFIPSPEKEEMRRQLIILQKNLMDLQEHYTDEHPKIKAVQEKIQKLKEEVKLKIIKISDNINLKTSGPITDKGIIQDEKQDENYQTQEAIISNPLYEHILKEIVTWETDKIMSEVKRDILISLHQKEKEKLKEMSSIQLEHTRLSRQAKSSERIWANLQDSLENLKVYEASSLGNLKIVGLSSKSGVVPPIGISFLMFVVLIGLVLGIGVAVSIEYLDDRIKNSYDVKVYLNLPTLGVIPKIKSPDEVLINKLGLKHPVCEIYNKISFQLQSLCLENKVKKILITSPKSGDGKTSMLVNIGISLARAGEKVLLVDTDLRRPSLHSMLFLSNMVGVSNLLSGELEAEREILKIRDKKYDLSLEEMISEIIQPTDIEGLFVIPSGVIPPNPVEIFRRDKTKKLFSLLKDAADFILFDSPPALTVIDASVIGSLADGVILVIDTQTTIRKEVIETKKIFTLPKVNILGVILNNVLYEEESYYYYYSKYYPSGSRKTRGGG